MAFLLGEDKALKERLQGIIVHDQKADGQGVPRQVGVFFGQPDQELRTQNYPYITIDLIDISADHQREMRGKSSAAYLVPDIVTIGETDAFETDIPIPVTLDYQITAYSRNPMHDRVLMNQLLHSKLPFRFGYIEVLEKSTTVGDTTTNLNTLRRLDVMDVSKRDITEAGKRLFMNAVTVRISSEIPQDTYRKLLGVQQVVSNVGTLPQKVNSVNETVTVLP
jgi:hypothetical protein